MNMEMPKRLFENSSEILRLPSKRMEDSVILFDSLTFKMQSDLLKILEEILRSACEKYWRFDYVNNCYT